MGLDTGAAAAARGAEVVLRTAELVKCYRRGFGRPRRAVLKGVQLSLRAGETVALVGPNGSGKSTLLRILAGQEAWDGGRVEVFGQSPSSATARARTGCMGETQGLPSELTGAELLQLFGAIAGKRSGALEELVAETLARVGLGDEGRTRIGRYSLGMKRRLALAAATFTHPSLLLLDEPSAGLDAPGHDVLAELVRAAREEGAAILFSSHQLDDLASLATRIVVLVDGCLIADDTPAGLVERTRSGRLELDGVDTELLENIAQQARDGGARVLGTGPGGEALSRLYRGAPDAAPSRSPEASP